MIPTLWPLVDKLSRLLEPGERDAVMGDLAEARASSGQALLDLLNLVIRRQLALWKGWRPWLALVGIVGIVGPQLSQASLSLSLWLDLQLRTYWKYGVPYQSGLTASEEMVVFLCRGSLLLVCSWASGVVLGSLSRRTIWIAGTIYLLVCVHPLAGTYPLPRHPAELPLVLLMLALHLMGQSLFWLLPSILGMRQGLRNFTLTLPQTSVLAAAMVALTVLAIWTGGWSHAAVARWGSGEWDASPGWQDRLFLFALMSWPAGFLLATAFMRRMNMTISASIACGLIVISLASGASGVRAVLKPEQARPPAAKFALKDAAGKSVNLSDYRGKVLLLNFWATWCGGCKVEIPWFQEFETTLGPRNFAVLGISVDDEGWAAVKPYIEKTRVTYRMALADKSTSDDYAVKSMPATFIIDRNGRIAATYIGLVDKSDIERNIRTVIGERPK